MPAPISGFGLAIALIAAGLIIYIRYKKFLNEKFSKLADQQKPQSTPKSDFKPEDKPEEKKENAAPAVSTLEKKE